MSAKNLFMSGVSRTAPPRKSVSIAPGAATRVRPLDKGGQAGNGRRVELQGNGLAAQLLDLGYDRPSLLLAAVIGDDDVAAMAGDGERGVAPEAATGAGDDCDAMPVSGAAFAVGYGSVSQFTREYGRMFGLPPARDKLILAASSAGAA